MNGVGHIVDFNSTDGLPPLVVQKLNFNFRNAAGLGSVVGPGGNDGGYITYESLPDKPSIESVELLGDKTFDDLGLEALTNSEIDDLLT